MLNFFHMVETSKKAPEQTKTPEGRFEALKRGLVKQCDYYAGWAREYLKNRQSKISVTDFIDLMANVGCDVTQEDLDKDEPGTNEPNQRLADAVLRAQVNLGFADFECDGLLGPKTCAALIEKKEKAVTKSTGDAVDDLRSDVEGKKIDILNPEKVFWSGTSLDVGMLAGTKITPLGGKDANSEKMWGEFEKLSDESLRGKVIVIGSTGNDSYEWSKTQSYLSKIIEKARAAGAVKVVLQNRVPYGKSFKRPEYVERAKVAREGIAKAWGGDSFVKIVDMYSKFAGPDGYMPDDLVDGEGWHPNAKAYAMMREYLVNEAQMA